MMNAPQQLAFGSFCIDLFNEQAWDGGQEISLKPKTFAMLRYLIEHAGQLVTKKELLDALWADVQVGDAVLKVGVREIRYALRDNAKVPKYIETVHRRGYRFIALLSPSPLVACVESQAVASPLSPLSPLSPARLSPSSLPIVGREAELAQLHGWLEQARQGERQLVFVTGEAGIGKTTLVEAFLQQQADPATWIGRGQCVEHYGAGEAYLPVLEALGRLGQEPGHERLRELLWQRAPTWLVQLSGLADAAALGDLQMRVQGASLERMLREMAEILEVLTQEQVLILWFEDLHWSDYSTIALLSYIARRPGEARLLIVGTYRPVEVIVHEHPLKRVMQELHAQGACQELALELLSERCVAEYLLEYLGQRPGILPVAAVRSVATRLHKKTEGHPFFLVTILDTLGKQAGGVGQAGGWEVQEVQAGEAGTTTVTQALPETIQQLIEQQLEHISAEEQHILAVASLAGAEFSAATVAAGTDADQETVENLCDALTRRRQFIQTSGIEEWPDGTAATRYRFVHALYQTVLADQIPLARQVRLHRQIGQRKEVAYGEQTKEIAAKLAMHFERGRETSKALHYLQLAGDNAVRQSAHHEAIEHYRSGLRLLATLPDTDQRAHHELMLQTALGVPLLATKGYADPEVGQAYGRARELTQRIGETPQLFPILWGLSTFYVLQADLPASLEFGKRLLGLAQHAPDPARLVVSHLVIGGTLLWLGEFPSARHHLEQSIGYYTPEQHRALTSLYAYDPGIASRSYLSLALWFLGYLDQAKQQVCEVLTLAQEISHPYTLAHTLGWAAELHQLRQEGGLVQAYAEQAITVSRDEDFPLWLALGTIMRGWALADQGDEEHGLAQIRDGIAACRAMGAQTQQTYFLALMAERHKKSGHVEEGLVCIAEALAAVETSGEGIYEAELHRLKGEFLLSRQSKNDKLKGTPSTQSEAEACFQTAIHIARRQEAKACELRAAVSLSRLWQQQGKPMKARELLAGIYGWFTQGQETTLLKDAGRLLEELA